MKHFVTSDTHWHHGNIRTHDNRPFLTLDEMNTAMIQNWNRVVGPKDRVYHLGDVCWIPRFWAGVLEALNGEICLVKGNHDRMPSPARRRFVWVKDYHYYKWEGERVIMMHYPIESWNSRAHGVVHLHGHSHGYSRPVHNRLDVGTMLHDYGPIEIKDAVALARQVPMEVPPTAETERRSTK